MRRLALLLTLAGCAATPNPTAPPQIYATVICPPDPAGPGPLPKLVDGTALRAWAEATETARRETAASKKHCRVHYITEPKDTP